MNRVIMAIDPGASGAIAWRDASGIRRVVNMPDTPRGIYDAIVEARGESGEAVCYLEDVGHGIPGQSSSATAKFARHNGHLEMALLALGIKVVKMTPQKWEKEFSLGKSSQFEKSEWKRRLKQKAEELYPNVKVTLKNADALLLLEVGCMKER